MPRNPQKMWEKGVPLSEAVLKFSNFPNAGDSLDKRQYLNLCEPAHEGECKSDNPDFYKYFPKEPSYRDSDRKKYKNASVNICAMNCISAISLQLELKLSLLRKIQKKKF